MGRIPKQHKPHGRQSRKSDKRNTRNQHKSASRQPLSKTGRRRSRRKALSGFAQKVIRPFRSVTLPGFSENGSADGKDSRWRRTGRILLKLAHSDRASGIIMLCFALAGLLMANLPVTKGVYEALSGYTIGVPHTNLVLEIGHWAQDGLLTIFFLVVGLELKQELSTGSLSNPKAAAVPMLAAVGGMLLPPVIFIGAACAGTHLDLVHGVGFAVAAQGWAVPTATDIAFSLAILAIFAKALPGPIRAFLMTLATVDDLLGIIIIAIFYSSLHAWYWFAGVAACAVIWSFLVRMQRVPWIIVAGVGLLAWVMMFEAGIHPTLAGVLVGLLTPAQPVFDEETPRAERYHDKLQPFSALLALPVFAFFATGISFTGASGTSFLLSPIVYGVILALVLGKPLGVLAATWLSTHVFRLKLAPGLKVRDLIPMATACGVGFTVAFLMASLAYKHVLLQNEARFGVLVGSLLSAGIAAALLHNQSLRYSRDPEQEKEELVLKDMEFSREG